MPPNVRYLGHVGTAEHNAFNCSARAVLNVNRASMAAYGFSPPTRVFEAAGASACLITDAWDGVEQFLEPGREILVAKDGREVAGHLGELGPGRARAIGEAARARVLAEHTYGQRAAQVEAVLERGEVRREGGRVKLVVLGLSITSSWGNGHATTYRGLLREFTRRGHQVTFLEREVRWYATNRDLPNPVFCDPPLPQPRRAGMEVHAAGRRGRRGGRRLLRPDGVRVGEWVCATARGIKAFYDIDTPVTLAKLARRDFEYLAPHLIPCFDLYLSFTGGPTLRNLEEAYGAPLARALYCSVDERLYRPQALKPRWDLGYLGTYSDDRQPKLERLLIEPARSLASRRFVVAGPLYPEGIAWPRNVARIDHLAPPCPELLRRPALHLERHRGRHGRRGLVAVRAAVRGGELRRADHQRRLGRPRRAVPARRRDPPRGGGGGRDPDSPQPAGTVAARDRGGGAGAGSGRPPPPSGRKKLEAYLREAALRLAGSRRPAADLLHAVPAP